MAGASERHAGNGPGYELVRRLARGSVAEVWIARPRGQGGSRSAVVLKTLVPTPETEEAIADLVARAAEASALYHPNVARVLETGELGEAYFVASELVQGRTIGQLRRALAARGVVPPLWFTLAVFAAYCDGLEHVHEATDPDGAPLGLAHGLLGPELLAISFAGVPKILDVGLASPLEVGPAPAARGELGGPSSPRDDVHALAAVLYEMLTGERPRPGRGDVARGEIAPPSRVAPWVPETLDSVLLTALSSVPANRYEGAGELRAALQAQLRAMGTHATQHNLAAYLLGVFGRAAFDEPEVATGIPAGQIPGTQAFTTAEDEPEGARAHGVDPADPVEVEDVLAAHDLAAWNRLGAGEVRASRPESPPPPRAPAASEAAIVPFSVSASPGAPPSARTGSGPRANRRLYVAVASTVLVALAAGGAILARPAPSSAPASSVAPPAPAPTAAVTTSAETTGATSVAEVELVVVASPPEARLFLDDAALADNPFRARVSRDQRLHKVRGVAPGHVTGEEAVTFEHDVVVRLSLRAEPLGAAAPVPARASNGRDDYPAAPAAPAPVTAPAAPPKEGDDLHRSLPAPSKTIDRKDPYAP